MSLGSKLTIATVFAVGAGTSGEAIAAGDWDMTATGCTIDPQTTALVGFSGPHAAFRSGLTGSFVLHCPVLNASQMDAPAWLEILYFDNSTSVGNTVTAYYYKVHKLTGAQTVVASISSDNCTPGSTVCSAFFTDTFAPGTYRYWVQVFVGRSSTANTVYATGITLW